MIEDRPPIVLGMVPLSEFMDSRRNLCTRHSDAHTVMPTAIYAAMYTTVQRAKQQSYLRLVMFPMLLGMLPSRPFP